MVTHFISLTLEQPLPESCGKCPFSNYSQPELYCPVLGDISEWHQHNDHIGEEQRHPDCKLQTWEAQRMLRFVVDGTKSSITPLGKKISTPEVRESERRLLEAGAHNGIVIREAAQEHLDKLIAETKRFKENPPPIEAQDDDR